MQISNLLATSVFCSGYVIAEMVSDSFYSFLVIDYKDYSPYVRFAGSKIMHQLNAAKSIITIFLSVLCIIIGTFAKDIKKNIIPYVAVIFVFILNIIFSIGVEIYAIISYS